MEKNPISLLLKQFHEHFFLKPLRVGKNYSSEMQKDALVHRQVRRVNPYDEIFYINLEIIFFHLKSL